MLASRHQLLGYLGRPGPWPEATVNRYVQHSTAVAADGPDAAPFAEILATLEQTQDLLAEALAGLDQAALAQPAGPDRTVDERLLGLAGKHEGGVR